MGKFPVVEVLAVGTCGTVAKGVIACGIGSKTRATTVVVVVVEAVVVNVGWPVVVGEEVVVGVVEGGEATGFTNVDSNFRIRLLLLSAMNAVPAESVAIPAGELNRAVPDGPPVPSTKPGPVLPARVTVVPVIASTIRTLLFPPSATNRLPAGSKAMPMPR